MNKEIEVVLDQGLADYKQMVFLLKDYTLERCVSDPVSVLEELKIHKAHYEENR
jgi:hypothetical protein